jgi:hypothetical protein
MTSGASASERFADGVGSPENCLPLTFGAVALRTQSQSTTSWTDGITF